MRVGSAIVVVAALVGAALAVPFLVLMAFDWWSTVSLGGWFSYVIVAWAAFWVLFALNHLFGDRLDVHVPWTDVARARRAIRRSETSVHGS